MTDTSTPVINVNDVIAASKACNAESNWDTSAFDQLLERGWDINSNYGHIGDALCLAVGANKAPLVQYLLTKGSSPNANLRGETYTSLELSCIAGADLSIPSLLISHGAEIKGRSALLFAARAGRVDILELLLSSSSSSSTPSSSSSSPPPPSSALPSSTTTTTTAAAAATSKADTAAGKALLNALPANEDVYDNARARPDWGTPLHGAVGSDQVAVVRWLLDRGADVSVRNHVGLTPKELADEKGFRECSELLSSLGVVGVGGEGGSGSGREA